MEGCGLTVGRRAVMPIGLTRAVCRSLAAVIQLVPEERVENAYLDSAGEDVDCRLTSHSPRGGYLAVVG